ncbi:TetR/AcrR family transcriptional regulator [Sulfitobacter sp. TSTF-M16]|uniref:TetR/AcrR family transcriptional regulator n=1 Tax=Sulfitobacter aestuariivivens TaxID=2766981 RepID=A0A927HEM9_9RHOB|nr:TetR/AcrR family transcriptional regulator [Sulfitobacter aestuariivivens]
MSRRASNRREKQQRILTAAIQVFAEMGYSAATMERIAEAAHLSKPTLYQYFDSKDALFKAMMSAPRDRMMEVFDTPESTNHVAQLLSFARAYADIVMRPEYLSLARLIIGEAQRFPDVGRAYQASGPDRVLDRLITFMEAQKACGALQFDDAELAAQDFWGLILSAPRNRALHEPDNLPSAAQTARYVENGVRVFLKAYGVNSAQDLEDLAKLLNR